MPSLFLDHLLCETILHAEQQHSKQKTWMLLSPLPLLCVQSENWFYLTLLAPENILFYTLFLNGIISEPETLMRVTCRATVNGEIVRLARDRVAFACLTLTKTTSRGAYHRAFEALWLAMDEVRGSTSVDFIMFKTKLIHCYTDGYD